MLIENKQGLHFFYFRTELKSHFFLFCFVLHFLDSSGIAYDVLCTFDSYFFPPAKICFLWREDPQQRRLQSAYVP